MKRHGGLYDRICDKRNVELAHENASKHKSRRPSVLKFNEDLDNNVSRISECLLDGTFKPTECVLRKVKDKRKYRVLSLRPYNKDKVIQHSMINVLGPIWRASFTKDTFSNLKGHGLHQCAERLKRDLHKDKDGTKYCLQIDLVQHYPTMSHDIIKYGVRRKIKDSRLLSLVDAFVDTMDGLSLGDPISGWLQNAVMSPFDHKVKEVYGVKYYYRFQDDMVFLSDDKESLRRLLVNVTSDMRALGQNVKGNWQIYEVDTRGIAFIGYRFFHGYTLLRKSIKKDIFRLISDYGKGKVSESAFKKSMASRLGWLKWCDSHRLQEKISIKIKEAQTKRKEKSR